MVRIVLMADVHGNLPALNAVLGDLENYHPDGIIVAGDLVAGPSSNETTRCLRSLNAWMIRGNTDSGLLRFAAGEAPASYSTSRQYELLRWMRAHTDLDILEFMRSLPEQRTVVIEGTHPIRVVHGSPTTDNENLNHNGDRGSLEQALYQIPEQVLVCGHTHEPWIVQYNHKLAVNPGSVACPLNGDTRAQYALLTWMTDRWHAELHAVPYDLNLIRDAFCTSGLLEEGGILAQCFLRSIETGYDFSLHFLNFARKIAAESGSADCDPIPDHIWELASENFNWEIQ